MKIIIYSSKDFERTYLVKANSFNHYLTFTKDALSADTIMQAESHEAVVVFTGDDVSANVIEKLKAIGVKYIAIRAAGFDNVDVSIANYLGIKCANVPEYSPYAIAEHAVALILALNRKMILADKQVHNRDFRINNLIGFDLNNKTVGIIGTGRIGSVMAKIMNGFGCKLLGFDKIKNEELIQKYDFNYTDLETLCSESDIITIHMPLNSETKYLIGSEMINVMKRNVILINTSRGSVLNTASVLKALANNSIGYLGIDVYENEKGVFFYDHSLNGKIDSVLARLLTYPNVIITPHQAFATVEALLNIAETTMYNLDCWAQGKNTENELH
ncbi:2-hydroxyacid dehydrogenase [Flavobacterium sp.]|uniref:2-hydroxyacid dehydrogenase n=1 Tax=Flavobacterium sp. TaxID=239 RepID=UPI003D6A2957